MIQINKVKKDINEIKKKKNQTFEKTMNKCQNINKDKTKSKRKNKK